MKILVLTSYITIPEYKQFSKNITGFGYMVSNLICSISELDDMHLDVITNSAITKRKKYKKVNLLQRKWIDIFTNIRVHYIKKMIKLIKDYDPPKKSWIKLFFYALSAGYIEKIIKKGNYDLVHIHGIGFSIKPYIDCCEKLGCKYLITLHGLNSFSDSVKMEECEKQFEKDFIKYAYETKINMSFISKGILKTIKNYLKVDNMIDSFRVIPNGTDIKRNINKKINIKKSYSLCENKKIILAVGNIDENKNQIEIVKAYNLLPKNIKEKSCVLFLGNYKVDDSIVLEIKKNELEKSLILCGNVSKEDIGAYYSQADYTILASISEGFGLSIIEGFVYGVPNITYFDLDAVDNLYNKKAMLLVKKRSVEELSQILRNAINISWDKEWIKNYSKKFSIEKVAKIYCNFYLEIIRK